MIRVVLFSLFSCLALFQAHGQYVLDAPDGKKVKLNTNGTWEYVKQEEELKSRSAIPKTSTAKYVDRFKKYVIWFDPTEWFYDTAKINGVLTWDATFYSKDLAINAYCMVSRLSMPVDELETTMRNQWQQSGNITSFRKFNDTLNDLPVTGFDMLLEFGGVIYQYRGYIHSTLKGSFQFMVGTQKEVFEEDREKIDLLLRGLSKN